MSRYIVAFIIGISFFILAEAVQANSQSGVQVEINDIYIDSNQTENRINNVRELVISQNEIEQFHRQGYVIDSAYPSQKTTSNIVFSLDHQLISFNFIDKIQSKQVTMTVSSDSIFSYKVILNQASPLSNRNGDVIQNTRCNSSQPCTPFKASLWDIHSNAGIGYTMFGQDIPKDFQNGTFYRHFNNNTSTMFPILMYGKFVETSSQAHLTVQYIDADSTNETNYSSEIEIITLPSI